MPSFLHCLQQLLRFFVLRFLLIKSSAIRSWLARNRFQRMRRAADVIKRGWRKWKVSMMVQKRIKAERVKLCSGLRNNLPLPTNCTKPTLSVLQKTFLKPKHRRWMPVFYSCLGANLFLIICKMETIPHSVLSLTLYPLYFVLDSLFAVLNFAQYFFCISLSGKNGCFSSSGIR